MGVDLGQWWRAGRYRALLDMIDQRPSASRLSEAIYTDPSNAQFLLDERNRVSHRRWAPRISEFDVHAQLLKMLVNDVRSLLAGAGPADLVGNPETAADALLQQQREAQALEIISAATPQYAHLFVT